MVLPTEKTWSCSRFATRLVVGAAGLGERLPGVGGQGVGPEVAVIAGGVAVGREDVREVRRPVAHDDLFRHAQRRERLALEPVGIDRHAAARGREVELHVDERAGQELDGREALVERRGALDLGHQLARHRLPGLDVEGEAVEHFRRRQPVLEQLRRELDVVARHAGAGERRVGHARRQPVESVAELVEEGLGVGPADQDRLAGPALHEVRVVRDDRLDLALEAFLAAVGVHPGAGALAGPGVRVEVPEADELARRRWSLSRPARRGDRPARPRPA